MPASRRVSWSKPMPVTRRPPNEEPRRRKAVGSRSMTATVCPCCSRVWASAEPTRPQPMMTMCTAHTTLLLSPLTGVNIPFIFLFRLDGQTPAAPLRAAGHHHAGPPPQHPGGVLRARRSGVPGDELGFEGEAASRRACVVAWLDPPEGRAHVTRRRPALPAVRPVPPPGRGTGRRTARPAAPGLLLLRRGHGLRVPRQAGAHGRRRGRRPRAAPGGKRACARRRTTPRPPRRIRRGRVDRAPAGPRLRPVRAQHGRTARLRGGLRAAPVRTGTAPPVRLR
ncbi:hypothetical protein STENM223S_03715 [Streptomyces tendae]